MAIHVLYLIGDIMAISIHGDHVPDRLPTMKCGGTPEFDHGSGYAYRCNYCGAVIGSMGQPKECKEMNDGTKYIEAE